jgi:hypothetical protein
VAKGSGPVAGTFERARHGRGKKEGRGSARCRVGAGEEQRGRGRGALPREPERRLRAARTTMGGARRTGEADAREQGRQRARTTRGQRLISGARRCRTRWASVGCGRVRQRSAMLTRRPGSTVPGGANSNGIQTISNGFKFDPNFNRSKRCLPLLEKFQIKYGWKELGIRNNLSYRNFSRFETEFDLKFRELL